MKKSFAEITNELRRRDQTPNFVSRNKLKFDVDYCDPVRDFLKECSEEDCIKITDNVDHARRTNDPKLLKKITSVIWEFRTRSKNTRYRLLAFSVRYSRDKPLFVITNGFIKKTSKVPLDEIGRAMKIRSNYLTPKNNVAKRW